MTDVAVPETDRRIRRQNTAAPGRCRGGTVASTSRSTFSDYADWRMSRIPRASTLSLRNRGNRRIGVDIADEDCVTPAVVGDVAEAKQVLGTNVTATQALASQ